MKTYTQDEVDAIVREKVGEFALGLINRAADEFTAECHESTHDERYCLECEQMEAGAVQFAGFVARAEAAKRGKSEGEG